MILIKHIFNEFKTVLVILGQNYLYRIAFRCLLFVITFHRQVSELIWSISAIFNRRYARTFQMVRQNKNIIYFLLNKDRFLSIFMLYGTPDLNKSFK